MSFWVHAFCKSSVAAVTPEMVRAGIAERLSLLTSLFCPDEEEPIAKVLARLRVEDVSKKRGVFATYLLHHRADGVFINANRSTRAALDEIETDVLPRLKKPKSFARVLPLLASVTEDVAFDLKASHVRGMGFPLAIAAAATLVAHAGGVILSGSYSWMVPTGREVDVLCELAPPAPTRRA